MTMNVTREGLQDAIWTVTQLWDEPLDEVHDIPRIVDAVFAYIVEVNQ